MSQIESRDQLINALNKAAELEHLLCCSYLYAGFSIRKSATADDNTLTEAQTESTRAWATQIMLIARQEMEHLGMVCNLLAALGVGANFGRANFPQKSTFFPMGIGFDLAPFSLKTLDTFIAYEAPHWPDADQVASENDGRHTAQSASLVFHSVQQLYEEIGDGLTRLNSELGAENLFLGGPQTQITNQTLFDQTAKGYQINLTGILATDPAERLPEALNMISQIIEEGEGAPGDAEHSHYARFVEIKAQYEQILSSHPQFCPALPCATNPQTFRHTSDNGGTPITDPLALAVAQLFNRVYEAMLLLLIRFYAQTDESSTESKAIEEIAFFPLMTMGIRPLGEVLTQLPVGSIADQRAGPPFEILHQLHFLPHKKAAWVILHDMLQQTGTDATNAANLAESLNSPVAQRLRFISLSLIRNARNFSAYIEGTEDI